MSDAYFIGIRVDDIRTPSDPDDVVGHAMLVLTDPSGAEVVYGMMPIGGIKVSGVLGSSVPGEIVRQEGDHPWDFEKRIPVSEAQYDAAMAFALSLKGS